MEFTHIGSSIWMYSYKSFAMESHSASPDPDHRISWLRDPDLTFSASEIWFSHSLLLVLGPSPSWLLGSIPHILGFRDPNSHNFSFWCPDDILGFWDPDSLILGFRDPDPHILGVPGSKSLHSWISRSVSSHSWLSGSRSSHSWLNESGSSHFGLWGSGSSH